LQFQHAPTVETIAELENRGIKVLQTVPENGLLVAVQDPARLADLQVRYAAPIAPSDKISPLIGASISTFSSAFYLAEFHPDVDMNRARSMLLNLGLELRENSDLHPRQLMVRVLDLKQLWKSPRWTTPHMCFPLRTSSSMRSRCAPAQARLLVQQLVP
jgi:hypothetical protein